MTTRTLTWTPAKVLNKANLADVPHTGGVYVLNYGRGVVYVGESGDLQTRLAHHLAGSANPCVARHVRLGVEFQYALVSGEANRKRTEQELIGKYRPKCNG